MSIIRQANLLGQQRIDVPHLRAIEASIAHDFDVLAGKILAGGTPLIARGFTILPYTGTPAASTLKLRTADSVILHPEASESGTIFSVPSTREDEVLNAANSRVQGGFTAGTTNYVGVDLRRTADATTADVVQFLDADTGKETPKTVPLARTLDYVIVISTQDFSTTPGVAPIAKVVTDANNNVVSVEDARNLAFRLGTGGAIPDPEYFFSWPGGRSEPSGNTSFSAGDKSITSLKSWMDATMTRLWELGGGEHWYSATADRNVKFARSGPTFTNGEWFEWDGVNLHWKGLSFVFENSTAALNEIADQTTNQPGLTDLADGDCLYVDIDRSTTRLRSGTPLQPVKAALITLSSPTVPGSRYIIAWRIGSNVYTREASFPVGVTFQPATPTALGLVKLAYTAGNPSAPVVAPLNINGSIVNTATGVGAAAFSGVGGPAFGPGGNFTGTGSGAGVVATGGTTGNGINATGTSTGAGGQFIGGMYGSAIILRSSSDSNFRGMHQFQQANGHVTNYMDHNGLPTARTSIINENWITTTMHTAVVSGGSIAGTVFLADIPAITGGGAAITLQPWSISQSPSLNAPAYSLFISSLNSVGDRCTVRTATKVVRASGLSGAVWEHYLSDASVNNNRNHKIGFTSVIGAGGITSEHGAYFIKRYNDSDWQAVVGNGSVAAVMPTGVSPTNNVAQLFRIEIYSSTSYLGNAEVRFYIDGTLVASHTSYLPSSSAGMYFTIESAVANATGSQGSLVIGPVTIFQVRQYNPGHEL
jgi:hypothetical protein